MKTVAVLLLNWNCYDETVACISSLEEKNRGFDFDVHVVDNGSRNNEFEKLREWCARFSNVHLYSLPRNTGFTGGNNFLLQQCAAAGPYRYYLLLNNDTEVSDNFLADFIDAVGGRDGIFGPQVRYFENKELLQSVGGDINVWTGVCRRRGDKKRASEYPELGAERVCDYIFGCAFLISHSVYEKLGGLDDAFFIYYEEVDYCVSARAHGFPTLYIPHGQVWHKDSVSTRKVSGFHIYTMWRNRVRFLRKHAPLLQRAVALLYVLAYIPYFCAKYGTHETRFLIQGTVDGLRGKIGNPMDYRRF